MKGKSKSYLCTTMTQERSNRLALLNIKNHFIANVKYNKKLIIVFQRMHQEIVLGDDASLVV